MKDEFENILGFQWDEGKADKNQVAHNVETWGALCQPGEICGAGREPFRPYLEGRLPLLDSPGKCRQLQPGTGSVRMA